MRLLIRSEQMAAIQTAAEEKFVERLAEHLRREYAQSMVILPDDETETKIPVAELPEETLSKLVRSSIEHARSHNLADESSIAVYTALMFDVAPNFDKHKTVRLLLGDQSIEPPARLDQLLEILNDGNWEAIRKTYQPRAWEPPMSETKNEESTVEELDSKEAM